MEFTEIYRGPIDKNKWMRDLKQREKYDNARPRGKTNMHTIRS